LLQGISLELHQPIFKQISRTHLFVYDRFLMVEADPTFQRKVFENLIDGSVALEVGNFINDFIDKHIDN